MRQVKPGQETKLIKKKDKAEQQWKKDTGWESVEWQNEMLQWMVGAKNLKKGIEISQDQGWQRKLNFEENMRVLEMGRDSEAKKADG